MHVSARDMPEFRLLVVGSASTTPFSIHSESGWMDNPPNDSIETEVIQDSTELLVKGQESIPMLRGHVAVF